MIINQGIERLAQELSVSPLNWENLVNNSGRYKTHIKHTESVTKDYLDLFKQMHLNEVLNAIIPTIEGVSREKIPENSENYRVVYDDLNSAYVLNPNRDIVSKYDALVFADGVPVAIDIKVSSGVHGYKSLRDFFLRGKFESKKNILTQIAKKDIGYIVCIPSREGGVKSSGEKINRFVSAGGAIVHLPFTIQQFREEGTRIISEMTNIK